MLLQLVVAMLLPLLAPFLPKRARLAGPLLPRQPAADQLELALSDLQG